MTDDAMGLAIGIDVGATSTRVGLIDSTGAIVERLVRPTQTSDSAERFVSRLGDDVNSIRDRFPGSAVERCPVGLAVPGTLDLDRKVVVRCTGISALEGIAVAEDLEGRVSVKVSLWTDADAATWGEYSARALPIHRFVHLRLGTGVACGAVIDGALQRLDAERTTHLESLVVDHSEGALPCACGLRGCLETVASGAALLRHAKRLGFSDGLAGVERAAIGRNEPALRLVDSAAKCVVTAINNLGERFRPDVICVGGGVLAHLPALGSAMMRFAAEKRITARIEFARLGDDAGIIGAARLALSVSSEK